MVGFLYDWGRGASRCVGCVKLLLRANELRIFLQFTKGVRNGTATLWLLYRSKDGVPVARENAHLCLCVGQTEYCLRLPHGNGTEGGLPLCNGTEEGLPLGVVLATECGERYIALMDGCGFSLEEAAELCTEQSSEHKEATEAFPGEAKACNRIEEALRKQECMEEEASRQLRDLASQPMRDRAEALLRRRPRVTPFAQSPFAGCVRISLSDVHFLLAGTEYAGNSFVCHAYYRYRHLLLATRYSGKEKPAAIYLLAPGVCSAGERRTGELYGFREFYCLRRSAWEAHAFGYYAMELEEWVTPDRERLPN